MTFVNLQVVRMALVNLMSFLTGFDAFRNCDLSGRKINLQTRKLWCRDRPSRALLLTCPNVKKLKKQKKK